MIRALGVPVIALLVLAQSEVVAQEREAYREAYRVWRRADPDLERDAATGGGAVGARADKAAAEAAKYFAARKARLDAQRADAEQKATAIEAAPAPAEFETALISYAASQGAVVAASIESIARDPDRGIQQLRQALERERSALSALNTALGDIQKGLEAVRQNSSAAEQSRGKLMEHYQTLAAAFQQSATQTTEAGALWTAYYRELSNGARGATARDPAPVTLTAPPRAPGAPSPGAGNSPGGNNPAPLQRTPTITALPLFRYVGTWVYPTVGAEYQGIPPESVELVAREENGQAKGTLSVRFQLSPGGPTAPTLRFDFQGPFEKTRNQSFPLITSGGAKGTVELIPGSAINLLEVRFTTDAQPGTVRQGGFLLVKK